MALFRYCRLHKGHFIPYHCPDQGDWCSDHSYFLVSSCAWLLILSNRFKIKVIKGRKSWSTRCPTAETLSIRDKLVIFVTMRIMRLVSLVKLWQNLVLARPKAPSSRNFQIGFHTGQGSPQFMAHIRDKETTFHSSLSCSVIIGAATRPEIKPDSRRIKGRRTEGWGVLPVFILGIDSLTLVLPVIKLHCGISSESKSEYWYWAPHLD